MVFKNIIFEMNNSGLENMRNYVMNPYGSVTEDKDNMRLIPTPHHFIHFIQKEGKKKDNWIKIIAEDGLDTQEYDNLILRAVYNNVKFHNIKFFITREQTEDIERFIFDKTNKKEGKNIFYLQHMKKETEEERYKGMYTAKISAHKDIEKPELIKLMSFLRNYL